MLTLLFSPPEQAYEVLRDPASRAEYDDSLKTRRGVPAVRSQEEKRPPQRFTPRHPSRLIVAQRPMTVDQAFSIFEEFFGDMVRCPPPFLGPDRARP